MILTHLLHSIWILHHFRDFSQQAQQKKANELQSSYNRLKVILCPFQIQLLAISTHSFCEKAWYVQYLLHFLMYGHRIRGQSVNMP